MRSIESSIWSESWTSQGKWIIRGNQRCTDDRISHFSHLIPLLNTFFKPFLRCHYYFFHFSLYLLLFLFLSLDCLLNDFTMILSLYFLLDLLFYYFSSRLERGLLIFLGIIEASYDVGFGHKFLHFKGKVLFSRILQRVKSFDDSLVRIVSTI